MIDQNLLAGLKVIAHENPFPVTHHSRGLSRCLMTHLLSILTDGASWRRQLACSSVKMPDGEMVWANTPDCIRN